MAQRKQQAQVTIPQDTAAEMAVLGSLLIDPQAIYEVGALQPEHFYLQKHRWIFEALRGLNQRNSPLDFLTVTSELERRGQLEKCGGAAFISELISAVPSAVNADAYAASVVETATRRRLLEFAQLAGKLAFDNGLTLEEVLTKAESGLLQLRGHETTGPQSFRSIGSQAWDELQQARTGARALLPTGYTDLDALLGGFARTDLWIVAARPGIGKSALLGNIATLRALNGARVGFFSLEMSAGQLFARTLVNQGHATALELRSGNIAADHWTQVADGFALHSDLPIWVDDTASINITALRSRALRLHLQHGLDLLCIDYVQLVTAPGGYQRNRQQEIGEITRGLKALAKELNCPIIAAAQLNRNAEGQRPGLADLREAGDIENDADGVIFIHRERECASGTVCPAELIVGKHRHGATGSVAVGWHGSRMAFVPRVQGGK